MKSVTIGLIQTKVSKNIASNVEKTVKLIKQAAQRGAKIICLQELFQTPYFPQHPSKPKNKYSETVPGPTSVIMQKLAQKLGVVIIVPLFEKAKNGKYYNTAVVFDDRGKMLGKYHKVHIPQDPGFYEKNYFEHGDLGYKIFKTKFCTFAVLICYDQWFPEAARVVCLEGAEMIFYPTAIANIIGYVPREGNWHNAWETVIRGHAIVNSVPVVTVNRVGREDALNFWGKSFVCNSFGKVLKRASANKDEVLLIKVDLKDNKYIRGTWGFLRNRQPNTYSLLLTKLKS